MYLDTVLLFSLVSSAILLMFQDPDFFLYVSDISPVRALITFVFAFSSRAFVFALARSCLVNFNSFAVFVLDLFGSCQSFASYQLKILLHFALNVLRSLLKLEYAKSANCENVGNPCDLIRSSQNSFILQNT